MSLEGFIKQNSSKWMEETEDSNSSIILSSRIRLARNIDDIPFP